MNKVIFLSNKDDWETPQDFYDKLNDEFHFTLDPCADENNHKCEKYFSRNDNGLLQDWGGHTVFVNPPYGAKSTSDWIRKCSDESHKPNTTVVMLIPARTDIRTLCLCVCKVLFRLPLSVLTLVKCPLPTPSVRKRTLRATPEILLRTLLKRHFRNLSRRSCTLTTICRDSRSKTAGK